MTRILLLLALGLIVINVTTGCNKTEDNTSMAASTNSLDTNSVATNAAPPAAH
jgi:hypothetical protein